MLMIILILVRFNRYWTHWTLFVTAQEPTQSAWTNWKTLRKSTRDFYKKDPTWKYSCHSNSYSTGPTNFSNRINITDTWVYNIFYLQVNIFIGDIFFFTPILLTFTNDPRRLKLFYYSFKQYNVTDDRF